MTKRNNTKRIATSPRVEVNTPQIRAKQPRVVAPTPTNVPKNKHTQPSINYNIPTSKASSHVIPPDNDKNEDEFPYIPDPVITSRYNLRSKHQTATNALALAVLNQHTRALEEYPALIKGQDKETWYEAYGNDLCRLAQGMPGRRHGTDVGTNTIRFIQRSVVTEKRSVPSAQTKAKPTAYA